MGLRVYVIKTTVISIFLIDYTVEIHKLGEKSIMLIKINLEPVLVSLEPASERIGKRNTEILAI
jgi:hypothetical protein